MKTKTEIGIKEVLKLLEEGNPFRAQEMVSSLYEQDLDSKELTFTNRCCTFWIDITKRLRTIQDPFERSQRILPEWKIFQSFLQRVKSPVYMPALTAMQIGFFSSALQLYTQLLDERDFVKKIEIYRGAGICYKEIGDYNNARVCLVEANDICQRNKINAASIIAELADCYALCGEERKSKVLFREAFFIDPESIDITFLDSELIKNLIKKTREKGYSGHELLYWIPVFGSIYRVFNITRDIESNDLSKIKIDFYAMENEFKDPSCNKKILIPRLFNYALRLIDFYNLHQEENMKAINELKNKMCLWDQGIYEEYIK